MSQKQKKIYKIWCEWDTDLTDKLFTTREAAMKELEAYDWITLVEAPLKDLLKEGNVGIREIRLHG